MKKYKVISSLMLSAIFLLGGCKTKHYVTSYEMVVQQGNTIIQSVLKKDSEELKGIFCPYLQDSYPDIDNKITDFLTFIEGEVISYDDPLGGRSAGSNRTEGVIWQTLDGKIENIRTDSGNQYQIVFSSFRINKENPEYVGITMVSVYDVNTLNVEDEDGYLEGSSYTIYYGDIAE